MEDRFESVLRLVRSFPDLEYQQVCLQDRLREDGSGPTYILSIQRRDFFISCTDKEGFHYPFTPVRVIAQEDGVASLQVLYRRMEEARTTEELVNLLTKTSVVGGHYLCQGGIASSSKRGKATMFSNSQRSMNCLMWFKPLDRSCVINSIYAECQNCVPSLEFQGHFEAIGASSDRLYLTDSSNQVNEAYCCLKYLFNMIDMW